MPGGSKARLLYQVSWRVNHFLVVLNVSDMLLALFGECVGKVVLIRKGRYMHSFIPESIKIYSLSCANLPGGMDSYQIQAAEESGYLSVRRGKVLRRERCWVYRAR